MQEYGKSLKRAMEQAARQYQGFVQFLWLPWEVVTEAMQSPYDVGQLYGRDSFQLFYIGADPDLSFTSPGDVEKVLERLFAGEGLKGQKK